MRKVIDEKEKTETIEKLKRSAKQEFLKYGFQRAGLRQICERAGVTTGAFYFYFDGKEAILKAILEPLVQKYEAMQIQLLQQEMEQKSQQAAGGKCAAKQELQQELQAVDPDRIMMEFILQYREEAIIVMEKAEGSCYENYHCQVEEAMVRTFQTYYTSQLGTPPDEGLMRILARNRVAGIMEIIKGNYDMEYSRYLSEKIGIYANGGTESLIENLRKDAFHIS